MVKNSKSAVVVKLNVVQKRKTYELKPAFKDPPKRAGAPTKDHFVYDSQLIPLPSSIYIGGLSDCYFALFAHIGQKEGCDTVYRRLTKFEITIKGPPWSMNTARTFLLLAEYFQKVWWYRQTDLKFKLKHLGKVDLKTILLSCPEIFKKPLHRRYIDLHAGELAIIYRTIMTLRDLETGEVYKKFANVPILQQWEPRTLIPENVGTAYANSTPEVGTAYANSTEKWEPRTLIIEQDPDSIGKVTPLGKISRKDILNNILGKPNPQVENLAVNYIGGALMRLQTMTGGGGRYKLQAFDCELPTDHRKMAEYLSCAFFSAWRNTGKEKVPSRSFNFETYAAIIGMSSYLKDRNRYKIIKVLNQTAPYFCTSWSIEGHILNFVMARYSVRKKDIYNG